MFSRVDADSEFAFHQMVSYAEFPPLVPPIMSKGNPEPRKRAGGFLHFRDKNKDIVAPIFRPDIEENAFDKKMYQMITKKLDIDPTLPDFHSYLQMMNYNQICYFELRPLAPLLVANWN
jgi:hypothetical protein